MTNTKSIFEVYAHEYDFITNAAQRESYHAKEVAALIERFKPTRALDAGCASGLTTLLLARQGIEAVGLDRSKPILEVARRTRGPESKAGKGLPISFVAGSFEKLPAKMNQTFDLVVCLANSISGVGSLSNLRLSLKNFHNVLRPGGVLVLQMLNYTAVTENRLMPIKATQNGKVVYERFTERQGKSMYIYVTRADFGQTPPQFEIFRHQFDNFSPSQVDGGIRRAGFSSIRTYGDLYMKKRFGAKSRDLVVVATRGAN